MGPWTSVGVVCILMGLATAVGAVSFHLGRSYQIRLQATGFYADKELPPYTRYAYFGYPFLAIFWLGAGFAALGAPHLSPALTDTAIAISAAGLVATYIVFLEPPNWVKPAWFRAEESQGFPILRGRGGPIHERMTPLNWMAVGLIFSCLALGIIYVLPQSWTAQIGVLIAIPGAIAGYATLRRHRRGRL